MKLIFFQGNDDYSAVRFHNQIREKKFNLKKLTTELEKNDKEMNIEWKDGRSKDGGYLTLHEFGDVDPRFVEFIEVAFRDYDMAKSVDFFIVEK